MSVGKWSLSGQDGIEAALLKQPDARILIFVEQRAVEGQLVRHPPDNAHDDQEHRLKPRQRRGHERHRTPQRHAITPWPALVPICMLTRVISTIPRTNQNKIHAQPLDDSPAYHMSSRKNIRLPTMVMISAGSIAATR